MTVTALAVAAKVISSPLVVLDLVAVASTATMTEAHQAAQEEEVEEELTAGSSSLLAVLALALLPLTDLQQNVSHRLSAVSVKQEYVCTTVAQRQLCVSQHT